MFKRLNLCDPELFLLCFLPYQNCQFHTKNKQRRDIYFLEFRVAVFMTACSAKRHNYKASFMNSEREEGIMLVGRLEHSDDPLLRFCAVALQEIYPVAQRFVILRI